MKKIFKAFKPFLLLALLCVLILIFLLGGGSKNAPIMKNRRDSFKIAENGNIEYTYNQLINRENFSNTTTKNGVTFINNENGSYTINGTATASILFNLNNTITFEYGHKYLGLGIPDISTKWNYSLYLSLYNGSTWTSEKYLYPDNEIITNTNSSVDNAKIYILINDNYTITNSVFKPQLVDLTAMYGAGNEPTSKEQFLRENPLFNNYVDYSTNKTITFYSQNNYDNHYLEGIYETNLKNQYGIWQYLYYVQSGDVEYTFDDLINEGYLSFGTFFTERFASQTYAESELAFYFNELPISQLDLNFLTGFLDGNYEVNIYTDGESKTFLIDNTETFVLDTSLFTDSSYINELYLTFYNVEYLGNIVDVNNMYSAGYDVGYNYGYNLGYNKGNNVGIQSGITEGKNEILANPSDYGLYNEEQYENYGKGQYQAGYDKGINEEAPTGLEWFKSAINVTQAFLDITILPGVSLIHIFSGFIILAILKWVLDWFRG